MNQAGFVAFATAKLAQALTFVGATVEFVATSNTSVYDPEEGTYTNTPGSAVVGRTRGKFSPVIGPERPLPVESDLFEGAVIPRGVFHLLSTVIDANNNPVTDLQAFYAEHEFKLRVNGRTYTPVMKPVLLGDLNVIWHVPVGDRA